MVYGHGSGELVAHYSAGAIHGDAQLIAMLQSQSGAASARRNRRRSPSTSTARPPPSNKPSEAMYAAGARLFVAVVPGDLSTRRVKGILKARPHLALALDAREHSVAALLEGLAKLAVAGVRVDFTALHAEFETELPDPASQPQPRGVVMINGTNLGKPYPPANGAAGRTPPNPTSSFSPVQQPSS